MLLLAALRRHFARFRGDDCGGIVDRFAMVAGVVAVGSVLSVNLVDSAAKRGALPEIVWRSAPGATRLAEKSAQGVDYTATATIPALSAGTRLDPCGHPK